MSNKKRKLKGKQSPKGVLRGDLKSGQIRWRKRDLELIEKEISNFNKRLYRQQKKNGSKDGLPERQAKPRAVEDIQTRVEFNRYISDLRAFNAKTAELRTSKGGTTAAKWFFDKVNRDVSRGDKEAKAVYDYINNQEVKQGNKGTGMIKRYGFGTIKEINSRPLGQGRNIEDMKPDEFWPYAHYVDRRIHRSYQREKQLKMIENYMRGLYRMGYSSELIDLIASVPPEKFLEIIETDVYAKFDWIYDPAGVEVAEAKIREAFAPYFTERSYFTPSQIDWMKEDVIAKMMDGYYGRAYENSSRKYSFKKGRK